MQPIDLNPPANGVPAHPPREPLDPLADAAREAGVTPEQFRRHFANQVAQETANAKPAPGPLLDAFLPPSLTALGLKLRPVVFTDFLILQKLDSPLARHLRELAKPEGERNEPDYSAEEIIDLIFLFTRPIEQARAILSFSPIGGEGGGAGATRFRESALREIGDKLPPGAFSELQAALIAIAANLATAFSTSIAHRGASPGDGSVFTPPPAAPKTASAGG